MQGCVMKNLATMATPARAKIQQTPMFYVQKTKQHRTGTRIVQDIGNVVTQICEDWEHGCGSNEKGSSRRQKIKD